MSLNFVSKRYYLKKKMDHIFLIYNTCTKKWKLANNAWLHILQLFKTHEEIKSSEKEIARLKVALSRNEGKYVCPFEKCKNIVELLRVSSLQFGVTKPGRWYEKTKNPDHCRPWGASNTKGRSKIRKTWKKK